MLVCAFPVHQCTRDRGCSAHPVFPAPSSFRGRNELPNFGRIAPREREGMSIDVIARSEATKQSISPRKGDCFVASLLAMTLREKLKLLLPCRRRRLRA